MIFQSVFKIKINSFYLHIQRKSPNNSEEIVIELRNKVKDLHEENEYLIKENQKKIEENKKLVKEIDRLSLNLDFKNRSGSRQSINRSLISNRDHSISDTESDKKSASVRSDVIDFFNFKNKKFKKLIFKFNFCDIEQN